MGCWGDGLLESDSALDTLSELLDQLQGALDERSGWVVMARLAPAQVADDPEVLPVLDALDLSPEVLAQGARSPELRELLGGICDGPALAPLSQDALAVVARVCGAHLDALPWDALDLYEAAGELAALGVMVELGVRPPPERVRAWTEAFDAVDARTRSERGFWDAYGVKVRAVLARLG